MFELENERGVTEKEVLAPEIDQSARGEAVVAPSGEGALISGARHAVTAARLGSAKCGGMQQKAVRAGARSPAAPNHQPRRA